MENSTSRRDKLSFNKIFVISNRGLYVYRASAALVLYAMAGHTYLVSGKITGGDELWVWIADENTGEIVAGRKPD
jgi:hypothetical protein